MAQQNILKTRISHKIDTLQNWESSTLVLLKGELAFVAEDGRYKVGDGTKTFSQLQFPGACAMSDNKAPTASDVSGGVGATWVDTTTGKYYICTNIANGTTATWEEIAFAKNYYTKTEIDQKFDETVSGSLENYYNKTEVDGLLENKVDNLKFTTELAKKASLGDDGKVPASQLPSYVDDVIEVENYASLPPAGESGKIYIDKETNKTYRWGGSAYVEISQSLALGETASTAFAGDRGKAVEDRVAQLGALANLDTVGSTQIDDGAVTESKIATNAVSTDKVVDGAVTEGKIAAGAVSADKIAANAVTNDKIQDGTIQDAKIVSLDTQKLTQAEGNILVFDCGDSTNPNVAG